MTSQLTLFLNKINYRSLLSLFYIYRRLSLISKLSSRYIVILLLFYTWLLIIAYGDVYLTRKGICERHKALKPSNSAVGRYSVGQKRCSMCALFIKWDGQWCPCCNCKLRANPRNAVDRRRRRVRRRSLFYFA
jgi:uncharacterized paraquat-inducible protein A